MPPCPLQPLKHKLYYPLWFPYTLPVSLWITLVLHLSHNTQLEKTIFSGAVPSWYHYYINSPLGRACRLALYCIAVSCQWPLIGPSNSSKYILSSFRTSTLFLYLCSPPSAFRISCSRFLVHVWLTRWVNEFLPPLFSQPHSPTRQWSSSVNRPRRWIAPKFSPVWFYLCCDCIFKVLCWCMSWGKSKIKYFITYLDFMGSQ